MPFEGWDSVFYNWIVVFMVTSWFAKPVYFEKGNSSILLLSTKFMRVVRGIRLAFQAERCRFDACRPLQFASVV